MNYVILIGLALFFVAHRDARRRDGMGLRRRLDELPHRTTATTRCGSRPTATSTSRPTAAASPRSTAAARSTSACGATATTAACSSRARTARSSGSSSSKATSSRGAPKRTASSTEVMPIVLRETAINVDERVAWLLQNRGQTGLLDEIDLIHSDFAQRVYTVAVRQDGDDRSCRLRAAHDAWPRTTCRRTSTLRTTLIEVHDARTADRRTVRRAARGRREHALGLRRAHAARARRRAHAGHAGSRGGLSRLGGDDRLGLRHAPRVAAARDARRSSPTSSSRAPSTSPATRSARTSTCARCSPKRRLASAHRTRSRALTRRPHARSAATSITAIALMALADSAELTPAGWRMLLESARDISGDFDCATLLTRSLHACRATKPSSRRTERRSTRSATTSTSERAAAALLTDRRALAQTWIFENAHAPSTRNSAAQHREHRDVEQHADVADADERARAARRRRTTAGRAASRR